MAMNVRFDDEETAALRAQAERERRSMQDVTRAAVREYIDRRAHKKLVEDSARRGATEFRDVLDRLGTL